MADKKEKKYVSDNAQLMSEWDFSKNLELSPHQTTLHSTKTVWWKCHRGHSWEASVDTRSSKANPSCPVCTNQLVITGINDLATVFPELLNSWDYEKNDVLPSEISSGYSKSVWWVCEHKHSWKTSVPNRKKQQECPYCAGRKILPGFNDLITRHPSLLDEWDFSLNDGVDPYTVAPATNKKYHWICANGHRYEASVASRTRLNSGCPVCAGQKILAGVNDLASQFPQLIADWDYEKNVSLNPNEISPGSEQYAWWKCSKGHSWEAMIASRTRGYGCPVCAKEYKTSIPEQAIFYYCKKYFPDAINGYKANWLGKSEIDIYIPSLNLGIEYDGRAWHKNPQKDTAKDYLCDQHGIDLIHIREPGLPCIETNYIQLNSLSYQELTRAIVVILQRINGIEYDVDVTRDINDIYGLLNFKEKEASLATQYPSIAFEWDYSKNGEYLTPDNINCKSGKTVYWICPKGHSYQARVDHRTLKQSNCPYCAGKKVIIGETDLASRFPHIAADWDYERNDASPSEYYFGSRHKAYWKCSKGHSWEASIEQRVRLGSGCPYCAGQKAIPGETDIKTIDPTLIEEWDYEKNTDIRPDMLLPHSRVKVWWKCSQGHSWLDTVRNRYISKHRKCPICRGKHK